MGGFLPRSTRMMTGLEANGNMQKWTPRHSVTPSPIKTNNPTNHYVHYVGHFGVYIVGRALRLPVRLSPPTSLPCAAWALVGQRHATIVWLLGHFKGAVCPFRG